MRIDDPIAETYTLKKDKYQGIIDNVPLSIEEEHRSLDRNSVEEHRSFYSQIGGSVSISESASQAGFIHIDDDDPFYEYHRIYQHLGYIKDNFQIGLSFVKYEDVLPLPDWEEPFDPEIDNPDCWWGQKLDWNCKYSLGCERDRITNSIWFKQGHLDSQNEVDLTTEEIKNYVENEFKEIMLNYSQRVEIELLCHNVKKEIKDSINNSKSELKMIEVKIKRNDEAKAEIIERERLEEAEILERGKLSQREIIEKIKIESDRKRKFYNSLAAGAAGYFLG
jgi:hypothetical protein